MPEEFRVEYVADRAETTSTVWLGLTVGCARCHDHKYDPITQKEYYQLFAYFNNVPEKGLVYNFGNDEPYIKAPTAEQQRQLAELDRNVAGAEQHWQSLEPKLLEAQQKWERKTARSKTPDWTLTEGLTFHSPLTGRRSLVEVAGCAKDEAHCDLAVVDGPAGKARQFDGNRFLESDGDVANFDYLQPFTFAAWIKPESDKGAILSHYEDYFEGQGHGLYLIDGKIRLHVVFRWTDIGLRVETVEPVKLNEWQHVLVTYDGKRKASGVHIYVNGEPQKLKVLFDELTWPMDVKLPLRIGAGGGLRFKGAIGDVRVYRIALTPEQAGDDSAAALDSRNCRHAARSAHEGGADKLRFAFLDRAAAQGDASGPRRFAYRAERAAALLGIHSHRDGDGGGQAARYVRAQARRLRQSRRQGRRRASRRCFRRCIRSGRTTGWGLRAGWWIAAIRSPRASR